MTEKIFGHFELAFEDDEEARLFAFKKQPVAGFEVDVSRQPPTPPRFLLYYIRKQPDVFEVFLRQSSCRSQRIGTELYEGTRGRIPESGIQASGE